MSQVQSFDGMKNLGVAYETFVPEKEHADPVIPTTVDPKATLAATDATPFVGRRNLLATTTIDLMMVFTDAAAAELGGTNAAIDKINSAVSLSNQIYKNSQIDVVLRLVKAYQVRSRYNIRYYNSG